MAYTFRHGDRPLDGYTIQRAVGRGGFGEVYYALADSGKQVALKYLRENAEVELRGIAHVMNLKSPHLVTIYDVRQTAENDPFVVMEYISGPSLRDLLNAEPEGLGPAKSAYFLAEIAKGLSYLHERGIVHRDLKPGNIFYDDGYVKIGDYGLSKHISVSKHSGQTVSVGTVHYMAPEIGSGSYTKAIDIYAMGVILYEMLTGKLPFSGSSMGEILMRHLSERPDVSNVPEPFRHVIAKALAKDPKDRYADINAMVDEITAVVDVSESMQTFDPATLSRVPRGESPDEPTRTQGGGVRPPPVPPMDVHGLPLEEAPARLRKKVDKLNRKLQKRMARYEARVGVRQKKWEPEAAKDRPERGQSAAGARPSSPVHASEGDSPPLSPAPHSDRGRQMFVLLLVMAGVSTALALLSFDDRQMPESALAIGLYIAGGTLGSLVAYFFLLKRSITESGFFERLAMAGTAAAFMIPAAILSDEELPDGAQQLIYPIIAVILFCDWGERIEMGRRRVVEAGQAFWPAMIGLIAGAIADAPVWTAAGLCAAVSLFTQAGAAAVRPVAQGGGGKGKDKKKSRDGGEAADAEGGVREAVEEFSGLFRRADAERHGDIRDDVAAATERATERAVESVRDGIRGAFRRDDAGQHEGAVETIEQPAGLRALAGVLAVLAFGTTLTCFIMMLAVNWHDDEMAGFLFGTLGGIAVQPFLLKKAFQKYRQPLWRGTLRFGTVSAGLLLASGMIALLSFVNMHDEEFAFSIVGLVFGGLAALVPLFIPGSNEYVPRRFAAPRFIWREKEREPRERREREQGLEIAAGAPSFVGRTANAGLSFLGKIMLLVGLTAALLYGGLDIDFGSQKRGFTYSSGELTVRDGYTRSAEPEPIRIPAIVPLIPLAIGMLCLVVARRNDGTAHFARGFIACALAMVGAIFAVGPAQQGLRMLMALNEKPDWSAFREDTVLMPIILAGVFLTVAIGLLFWPKEGRVRSRRRIVV